VVTSVVYESCWILVEKYVLVFRVSCGFSVDFSFVTVFGDRNLDPDFLGHDFSQSLTQSILIFSHLALNLHPVRAHRPSVPLAVYGALQSPSQLSQWPHPALSKSANLLLFSAPVKPCAGRIFSSLFSVWVFACLFSCEQTAPSVREFCFAGGLHFQFLSFSARHSALWFVQSPTSLVPFLSSVIPRSEKEGTKPPYVCPGCSNHTHDNN
jgi:hypothetical protein